MRKFISVKNLKKIGSGMYGVVYIINDKILIKVLKKEISYETIEKEYNNFKNAYLAGVCTANAYEIVDTEEGTGFTFDYLKGDTFVDKIIKNPYKFLYYDKLYGKTVKEMHSKIIIKEKFESRKDKMLKNIEADENSELKSIIYNLFKWIPESNNFIHGDPNIKNFLFTDNKGFVIDLADASYGNPIFDLIPINFSYLDGINIVFIITDKYKDTKRLDDFVKELIANKGPDILRIKILRKIIWARFLTSYLNTNIFTKRYKKANYIISIYSKIFFIIYKQLLEKSIDVSFLDKKNKRYIKNIKNVYKNGKDKLWGNFQFV